MPLLIWQQRWGRRDLESQPWIAGPPPIRTLIRPAVQTKVDVQLEEAGLSRRLLQLPLRSLDALLDADEF